MKPRAYEAHRLDVEAFARDGAKIEGRIALLDLPRLTAELRPGHGVAQQLADWSATGSMRRLHGGNQRPAIALIAHAEATMTCQRCLGAVGVALEVDRLFAFAADEDEASRLDEDSEEDVLVLSRAFDLVELLEDELILALPLVPRHDACPLPLSASPQANDVDVDHATERANPFAALEVLRRAKPPSS